MSETYQQKEWELNSLIDNLNSIGYTYEEYKKEVNHFIDRLLEDTEEINTLRNKNKRLNKSLEEQRHFYLEKLQQKENIIKEVRKSAERELKIAEENIKNSEQWLEVEEEQEHAKKDIHTGKVIKRCMKMFLEILDKGGTK